MFRGLYAAATALDGSLQRHEIIAQNLAHLDVPGYRRQDMNFESFDLALGASAPGHETGDILGTRPTGVFRVFEPGTLKYTGNPLDVALTGDGFFVVDGPNGPLYTRNGTFEVNVQGELQTKGGLPVAGTGGRIIIPPDAASVTISPDGTLLANGTTLGQLQVVRFANPNQLTAAGTTLFEAPAGVTPEQGEVLVHQGYREGSNVNAVNEMVAMIAGMRHYEASQRALRALSEAVQQHTTQQA